MLLLQAHLLMANIEWLCRLQVWRLRRRRRRLQRQRLSGHCFRPAISGFMVSIKQTSAHERAKEDERQ